MMILLPYRPAYMASRAVFTIFLAAELGLLRTLMDYYNELSDLAYVLPSLQVGYVFSFSL